MPPDVAATIGLDSTAQIIIAVSGLIASIGSLIGVIVGVVLNLKGARKISDAVEEVHLSTNSKMDTLLKQTRTAEFARGKLEGIEQGIEQESTRAKDAQPTQDPIP